MSEKKVSLKWNIATLNGINVVYIASKLLLLRISDIAHGSIEKNIKVMKHLMKTKTEVRETIT